MISFKYNIKSEKGEETIFVGRKRKMFFIKRNGKTYFPLETTTNFEFNGQKRVAKHNEVIDADGLLVFVNAKNNLSIPTLTLESGYKATTNNFVNNLKIWVPMVLGIIVGYAIGYLATKYLLN
ncbi:MAG: DUF4310 family protein [Acholeplasmataceae bacterium]|jgi:hypothetical protein|nr:DUF4310 family protein [Acholeplasmataceae bacterium]